MTSNDDPGGALFLVATPIGNLEDVTARAAAVLREADRVLAEDTRRTRILLSRIGSDRPLQAFDAHRERDAAARVVERIAAGDRVALVSDAGTPCVSDPGAALVRAVREAGLPVVPIPGASAVTAAVAVSGVEGGFRFVGFLPRRGRERRAAIDAMREAPEAFVLFESPVRTPATLADLAGALGADRPAVLCRELTKIHEEVVAAGLGDLAARFSEAVRGEVTIVVMPPAGASKRGAGRRGDRPAPDPAVLADRLLAEGVAPSRVARVLADLLGLPRAEAWQIAHGRL